MGKKRPKLTSQPNTSKKPRIATAPETLESHNFCWRIHEAYTDYDHAEWGWSNLSCKEFFAMLSDRLHSYEDMSWASLNQAKSCHPMPVEKISPKARQRLKELCDNQIDTLYQVKLSPKCRLWGYRDRKILYLIWHDPDHTVYPLRRR